jgi:hypothetical protein
MANSLANRILPSSPDSVEDLERRINNILSSLELEPISLTKPLVEVLDNQEEVEGDENRGGSTVAPTL